MKMAGVHLQGHGGYRDPDSGVYHIDDECPRVRQLRQLTYVNAPEEEGLMLCPSCIRVEAERAAAERRRTEYRG